MPREFENINDNFVSIPSKSINRSRQTFAVDGLKNLISMVMEKKAARLTLRDGIELCFRKEEIGWGISLSICRHAQWPDLLSDTLKRRFVEAEYYDGYFLCIDSRNNFVGWYALTNEEADCEAIEGIIHRMLSLMGFGLRNG